MDFKTRFFQLPVEIQRRVFRNCDDFKTLVNIARSCRLFYKIVGLDFKKLCLQNLIFRRPGETWVDAFYHAEKRSLRRVRDEESGSHQLVSTKKGIVALASSCTSNVAVFNLDLATDNRYLSLKVENSVYAISFTSDDKKLIISVKYSYLDDQHWIIYVLDTTTWEHLKTDIFDGYDSILHMGLGVVFERKKNVLLNYASGEEVDIPKQIRERMDKLQPYCPTPFTIFTLGRLKVMFFGFESAEIYDFGTQEWSHLRVDYSDEEVSYESDSRPLIQPKFFEETTDQLFAFRYVGYARKAVVIDLATGKCQDAPSVPLEDDEDESDSDSATTDSDMSAELDEDGDIPFATLRSWGNVTHDLKRFYLFLPYFISKEL